MSKHDLARDTRWLVASGKATCSNLCLNGGADSSDQDIENKIPATLLAHRLRYRQRSPVPFCFVCTRQTIEMSAYRRTRARNTCGPPTLDTTCATASTPRAKPFPTNSWLPPRTLMTRYWLDCLSS